MSHIQQFREISDYIKTLNLKLESRLPDFLIYSYENINHDGFAQLSAYRQHYFEINFEITEGCHMKVDQFDLRSAANRITLVSPHRLQTIQTHTAAEGPHEGYGILFSPEFISTNAGNASFLRDFPFFSPLNSPAITLKKNEVAYFNDIIRKIQYEYDHYNEFSKDIIKNYLHILFLKAKKNYYQPTDHLNTISREQEIYNEFESLVQKHFLELTSVKAYADKIYVSPKHLSETVKKVSGQSALQLIHKAQLNYAKALLLQTNKNVSEIAYELNFENPDYFSVFFKRLTGKSPLQFRIS